MAARKSTAKPVDEAQNVEGTEPTEEKILQAAQAMRAEYHSGAHPDRDIKTWEELSEAKQQVWLDKVTGQGD